MVKSVDRALSMLEYLSKRRFVSVTELADVFEVDKGTVTRILQTFEQHGMVTQVTSGGKYRIGSGTLLIARNVATGNSFVHVAHPILERLAGELNVTARLCVMEGNRVSIIDEAYGTKGRWNKDADVPGISKPLYCSAIGKIILAYLKGKALRQALENMELIAYTENTITRIERLYAELQDIRSKGYATNAAEYSDYAYCVAVPIFLVPGEAPRYCLGITGPEDLRKRPADFKHVVDTLKSTSKKMTEAYDVLDDDAFLDE